MIHNHIAWFLATCPDPKLRDPSRALASAKKAVELAPEEGDHWNTLGVAHYRAGHWHGAIEARAGRRSSGPAGQASIISTSPWLTPVPATGAGTALV